MSCGVDHRPGSDLALVWLWCRPAAVAPIQPLAWEPPYAALQPWGKKKKKELAIRILTKILIPTNRENECWVPRKSEIAKYFPSKYPQDISG